MFEFGDEVIVYSRLVRVSHYDKDGVLCKTWRRIQGMPLKASRILDRITEGIFIGRRTLWNGYLDYDIEDFSERFAREEKVNAYLIAWRLGNPFYCFREDLVSECRYSEDDHLHWARENDLLLENP